ncbi:MAG: Ig-like domain-containing protein, partial [Lachnospiraceae bacterium]|nr:Ig-like domain-containing protein [Lachnospiraceae bacterium]
AYIDAGESKGDWWLRTLGEVSSFGDKACHIDGEGRLWIVNEESYVSDLSHTVRPALHLNLAALDSTSNSVWSYAGKITSDGREIGAEAEIKVTEVRLSDTDKTLKIGEKYQIEATVLPANAADKTLTYKSSDDSVLSVSADGEVEAKKAGTATVTVMSANGKMAQLQVTVEEEPEIPGDVSGNEFGLSNPVVDNGVTTWDCIYFGSYWQNDTNGNGRVDNSGDKEPIKWRVLSVDGDDVFLLSDRNLSRQVYNSLSDEKGVKWETSTIRSWLNGYNGEANICGRDYTDDNFLDTAFDEVEQAAIKDTLVVNTDNSSAFPDNGRDTTDKVYLLSVPEIMKASYGFVSTWNKTNTREAKNTAYIDAG